MSTAFDHLSLTDFLHTVQGWIAQKASEGAAYRKSWGDEYAMGRVSEAWADEDGEPFARRFTGSELGTLSQADRTRLGFRRWDDESGLILIPIWAFNFIADGERLTSISGDTKVKGGKDEIDLDVRGGCIAYGFPLPCPVESDAGRAAE